MPLMLAALVALGAGITGGLARIGWELPGTPVSLGGLHGPLMVSGFFGTLITLERAVAVGRTYAYAAPVLAALGMGAWLGGAPPLGMTLVLLAGVVFVGVYAGLLRRQAARFLVIEALGAMAWAVGSARALAGAAPDEVARWGMAFLVLTISGERLELSRLVRPPRRARAAFDGLVGSLLTGLGAYALGHPFGIRLVGGALVGLALWFAAFDVARRTVRSTGLPRYIAVCLMAGYVWLGVGGALLLAQGPVAAGPLYDAQLHAVFVGFVLSMVFGHAPVIFPAVTGLPIPFHRGFYAPLLLLHATLVARVAGDLSGAFMWRRAGALGGAATLVLFLLTIAASAAFARRETQSLAHE